MPRHMRPIRHEREELPDSVGNGGDQSVARTQDNAVEVLPRGWYEDPYLRWRARYWDGERWTELVANRGSDPTEPRYGRDPLPSITEGQSHASDSLLAIVEALYASELARLRAEAEGWRMLAEDRRRALDALEPLIEMMRDTRPQLAIDAPAVPLESPRMPSDGYVELPPHVREAAMHELATVEARMRKARTRESEKRRGFRRRRSDPGDV